MQVLFQPLRGGDDLRQLLQKDGWELEGARDGGVLAEHPEAVDEPAARQRLGRLGLLTSGSLRIEFFSIARSQSDLLIACERPGDHLAGRRPTRA